MRATSLFGCFVLLAVGCSGSDGSTDYLPRGADMEALGPGILVGTESGNPSQRPVVLAALGSEQPTTSEPTMLADVEDANSAAAAAPISDVPDTSEAPVTEPTAAGAGGAGPTGGASQPDGSTIPSSAVAGATSAAGSAPTTGNTGATGPTDGSPPCIDSDCVAVAETSIAGLSGTGDAPSPFLASTCEAGVCSCQTEDGQQTRLASAGSCVVIGRAGNCILETSEVVACAAGEFTCSAACDLAHQRMTADASAPHTAEVVAAACDSAGICRFQVDIDGQCFADQARTPVDCPSAPVSE